MCWMVWLPPTSGRDPATLRVFLDRMMARASDNPAGAGAAWFIPGALADAATVRALRPDIGRMVRLLTRERPPLAWGVFHVRRAPQGNRATRWCHPHTAQYGSTRMLLTYNGVAKLTRTESPRLWDAATRYYGEEPHVSPILVPMLISVYGLAGACVLGLPQTVVCYEEEDDADQASWRIVAWRRLDRLPLYHLANGGIASENEGVGEFSATHELPPGTMLINGYRKPDDRPVAGWDADGAVCAYDL